METLKRFTLPRMFWEDHAERCADHAGVWNVISTNGRTVVVDLDKEALADLRSDAELYGDKDRSGWDKEILPLCRSAAATLKALWKRGA